EDLLSLLEITKDQLPGLSPSRTDGFFQSVEKLRHGLNLSRRILSRLTELLDLLDLIVGVTHLLELFGGEVSGELCKRLGHDLRSEPLLLERLSEATVLLDEVVNRDSLVSSGLNQGIPKGLATHAGVNDRIPVHQSDGSRRHSLRKLVHRGGCLLSIRARERFQD